MALRLGKWDPKMLYYDALECMTLLSQRLGSHKFFFGDSPSSLDAYVFGHLAPLLMPLSHKVSVYSDSSDFDNEPNKRRNQILSVLFAMGSMLGYAILMGIVSIQHVRPQAALVGPRHIEEEEEE
ncbi:unnamed protein product [Coregonus sp. 'balchen']|nr:unnamed protein product [Coregonus sp. 'balchen']